MSLKLSTRNKLCQSRLPASSGPEQATGCGGGQGAGLQERLTLNPEWPEVLAMEVLMEVDTEDEGEAGSTSEVVGGVQPLSPLLPDSLHPREGISVCSLRHTRDTIDFHSARQKVW